MKRFVSFVFAASIMVPAAASYAGNLSINIGIPVPPVPTFVVPVPPPPRAVVVLPPPPVVIAPGPPAYWFWDAGRSSWFYYDVDRRPHYVRRHKFCDDGRHYYSDHGRWFVVNRDMGRHRGWYKRHEREARHERREERHGRWRHRDRDDD